MDDFNDFLFFLTQKLSTTSWDRVGNCCLQRHNEEGHFVVFDICQLLLKNHWSVCRRRAVTDKKTLILCIDPKVFVWCVFPEKNPNHHGKKWWLAGRWCSHQEFHSKTINDFQSYNPITVPQKKFDPTCHNRQQHCHLTITGSQEKQINAKWKEGFPSYF